MADNDPRDTFPSDLSGHFWATVERVEELDRWRFTIRDYQNNVMLTGVASNESQAARIVHAWDDVIVAGDEDPSLGWGATSAHEPL
jgi:hypothetical protein